MLAEIQANLQPAQEHVQAVVMQKAMLWPISPLIGPVQVQNLSLPGDMGVFEGVSLALGEQGECLERLAQVQIAIHCQPDMLGQICSLHSSCRGFLTLALGCCGRDCGRDLNHFLRFFLKFSLI